MYLVHEIDIEIPLLSRNFICGVTLHLGKYVCLYEQIPMFFFSSVCKFVIFSLFVWLCFKGILFVVAYNVILRNSASWSDRPLSRGDAENYFSLLLSTNILLMAVLESV